MKELNTKPQTFREKLYSAVSPSQRKVVDALIIGSIRGSDRIDGVQRSSKSYGLASPCDLPRTPRDER